MRILKRGITWVLAVVMGFGVWMSLGACSSDPLKKYEKALAAHSGLVTLQVWTYYNNEQSTAFQRFVDAFNNTVGEEKKIHVVHTSYLSVNALAEALDAAAGNKVGAAKMPQLFQSYVDDLIQIDGKYGNVASLNKYFKQDELDAFVSGYLAEGLYDGENLKVVPVAKSSEIFMLDKTDWDKFAAEVDGVSLNDLKTVEGIAAVAEKYYRWSGGKAFFGRDAIANYFFHSAASQNKPLFSVTDGKAVATFDKGLLKDIYDNYYVPYVRGYFKSNKKYRSDDVQHGDVIAYVGSTSSAGYFPGSVRVTDDESYPIECYVAEVPLFEGAQPYMIQQGAGFAVTKSDEVTEYAACLFLKYLTDSTRNGSFTASMEYLPVVNNALDYENIRQSYLADNLDKRIAQEIEKNPSLAVNDQLKAELTAKLEKEKAPVLKTYEVALEMTRTHTMYLPAWFASSNGVRKILDACLQGVKPQGYGLEKLKNATDLLSEIDDDLAAGTSGKTREQLIEEKLDGNFELWYRALVDAVENCLAAAA